MRYWVYDEENTLFRKFWTRWEAARFVQDGWKIVVRMKEAEKPPLPTTETHGEALW